MKRFTFIIFLLVVALGCSGDDDTSDDNETTLLGLDGKWNMSNVSGGFLGVDHDFQDGLITWEFNESAKKVIIVNSNTDTTIEDSLPSDTYDYTVVEFLSNLEITIGNKNLGNLEITSNSFTISEPFKDGFQFTFTR